MIQKAALPGLEASKYGDVQGIGFGCLAVGFKQPKQCWRVVACSDLAYEMGRLRLSHSTRAGLEDAFNKNARQDSADHLANNRETCIAPIGPALSGNGQDRMGDARTKVAGRINRESRCAPETQSDDPNYRAHQKRSQRRCRATSRDGFGKDGAD